MLIDEVVLFKINIGGFEIVVCVIDNNWCCFWFKFVLLFVIIVLYLFGSFKINLWVLVSLVVIIIFLLVVFNLLYLMFFCIVVWKRCVFCKIIFNDFLSDDFLMFLILILLNVIVLLLIL